MHRSTRPPTSMLLKSAPKLPLPNPPQPPTSCCTRARLLARGCSASCVAPARNVLALLVPALPGTDPWKVPQAGVSPPAGPRGQMAGAVQAGAAQLQTAHRISSCCFRQLPGAPDLSCPAAGASTAEQSAAAELRWAGGSSGAPGPCTRQPARPPSKPGAPLQRALQRRCASGPPCSGAALQAPS